MQSQLMPYVRRAWQQPADVWGFLGALLGFHRISEIFLSTP